MRSRIPRYGVFVLSVHRSHPRSRLSTGKPLPTPPELHDNERVDEEAPRRPPREAAAGLDQAARKPTGSVLLSGPR